MSTAVWMVMWSEPVMRAPVSGLVAPYALAERHEARHLDFGELDLLAAELGEREIGDLEVGGIGRGGRIDGGRQRRDSFISGTQPVRAQRVRVMSESARITG